MWQQGQLWQLFMEFQDCFACDDRELGQTHLVQHDIDTGDAVPICQRDAMPICQQPKRLPLR